jgi:hypothetical protein
MSRRSNRRRYRKQRKHLFMRQLISYLTREKKIQEKEKVTDIIERMEKVLVSETGDHTERAEHKENDIQNIFRELTI